MPTAGLPSRASSASTADTYRRQPLSAGTASETSGVCADASHSTRTPRSSATGRTRPPTRSVYSPIRLTRPGAQNVRNGGLATGGDLAAACDRVERDGCEEDQAGGDVLAGVRVADEVDAVADHADDQTAEERAADTPPPAEEAHAADHGCGDRVEQNGSAARREVDRVETRGEDDPAERSHRARDHEHEDADQFHVDAGAARRLRVATHRVDMPAEPRSARDVAAEHDDEEDDQPDERDAAR